MQPMNILKTKSIRLNPNRNTPVNISGQVIENTEEFTYLSSIINKDDGANEDVPKRIEKAQQAFGEL